MTSKTQGRIINGLLIASIILGALMWTLMFTPRAQAAEPTACATFPITTDLRLDGEAIEWGTVVPSVDMNAAVVGTYLWIQYPDADTDDAYDNTISVDVASSDIESVTACMDTTITINYKAEPSVPSSPATTLPEPSVPDVAALCSIYPDEIGHVCELHSSTPFVQ